MTRFMMFDQRYLPRRRGFKCKGFEGVPDDVMMMGP